MTALRIASDPNVLFGKPVIAGTRISVELILEELGAGASVEDLLREYPHLNRGQIVVAVFQRFQDLLTAVFPQGTTFTFGLEADPDAEEDSAVCTATLPPDHPVKPLAYYDDFVTRWARLSEPRLSGLFTLLVR
jgi:uncharacterized protein (DUF433 family)